MKLTVYCVKPGVVTLGLPCAPGMMVLPAAITSPLVPPGTFWSCAYPRAWGMAPSRALPASVLREGAAGTARSRR